MLTIAATLITCAPINAQQLPTVASIALTPETIGLGQYILFNAWITPPPSVDALGNPIVYHNLTFTITKPNGTTETRVIANSEGPGTVFFVYVPAAIGTYSVKLSWAGQADREACESPTSQFTVLQEAPPGYPLAELPPDYWERPINAENREWYQLSGAWSSSHSWSNYNGSSGCYNPYSKAPNTAHILWTKDVGIGGLVGGEYMSKFASVSTSAVTMFGRVYYLAAGYLWCADLRTGEELWKVTASGSLLGMPLYATTAAIGGAPGWAVGGIWTTSATAITLYDPYTGVVKRTFSGIGAPFGTADTFIELIPDTGECYFYIKSWDRAFRANYYKWDARKAAATGGTFASNLVWMTNITQTGDAGDFHPTVWGDVFVGCAHFYKLGFNTTTGVLIYNSTNAAYEQTEPRASGYGKVFVPSSTDRKYRAYDIETGDLIWTSDAADYPWGAFWTYATGVAYGNIYAGSYDGHLYCFDADTGDTVWDYYSGDDPTGNTPYGDWPFYGTPAIADGKVYKSTTEHSPTQPFVRGFRLYCFDAITGDKIWDISGAFGTRDIAIAEGALLTTNAYNGLLHCFDKGPTTTSVSVSQSAIANGSSVFISGRVLDQSPAQPDTPCVSKDIMSAWMEYLHMQKPAPAHANITGVPVTLYATAEHGEHAITLGTVVSDEDGYYNLTWTPTTTDHYRINTIFGGDDSYYSSYGTDFLDVTETPAETDTEPQAPVDYTPMFAGIIAAVAVVAILVVYDIISVRKLRK